MGRRGRAAGEEGQELLDEKCLLPRSATKPGANLEFHAGWSGWTRPPTMGGGGFATSEQVCKRRGRVSRGF